MNYAITQNNQCSVDYIHRKKFYTQEEAEAVEEKVYLATGIIKLSLGIAVNTTFYMMLNALDALKKHPNYKHKVKADFNRALKAYKDYERALRTGSTRFPRFFNVADFSSTSPFKADMTNGEYFDLWQGLGGSGYDLCKNEINVLKHKYYLILERRGDKYPDAGAYALAVVAAFRNAKHIYEATLQSVHKAIPEISMECLEGYIFKPFDVRYIAKAWEVAVWNMYGNAEEWQISDFEDKNLTMALAALEQKWASPDFMMKAESDTIRDYNELVGGKRKANVLIKELNDNYNNGGAMLAI